MTLNNPTEPHTIQLEKGNADHLIGPFSHLGVHHPRLQLMPVTGSQAPVSPHSLWCLDKHHKHGDPVGGHVQ